MRLNFTKDDNPRPLPIWQKWGIFVAPWIILAATTMLLSWELTGGGAHSMWVWNQDTHSTQATIGVIGGMILGLSGLGLQLILRADRGRRVFWFGLALLGLMWSVRVAGPAPGILIAWGGQAILGLAVAALFAREEKLI
ncbi:hypothetical protein [Corynebacterium aquilae]|uniref:Uncharacterized protein n=1 Tax=Corynebacterium aquilae DSM 44791 TaxID=1431546 RepID=A0A1L7CIT4_9CORY|nr:hypothetical protein [Corynebacterium aquilae]APT85725.1 hypothetical protein CAQU_12545 [Corynebacterium aquilae DSM 44791]